MEAALESLQPIRDLAKNWDIDIAACLEDYLQDLLLGDITEEERQNLSKHASETLNFSFSQAALLLQNSSNVYGRKVEYLYNLVLQVQEELTIAHSGKNKNGKSSEQAGSTTSRRSASDADIDAFHTFDNQNVDFLLLDDVLPTDEKGNKINLRDGKENLNKTRESGISFATAGNATRLSLGATLAGGASRLDHSGASTAAHHHIVAGSLDAGTLRLIDGKCDVGSDGILILPGAGGNSGGKVRRSSLFSGAISPRTSIGGASQQQTQDGTGSPVDFNIMGDDYGGDYYDEDNDDGVGFNFADNDDNQNGEPGDPASSNNNQETQSTPKRGTTVRHGKSTNKKEKKEDPWALLDPHSQVGWNGKSRPLRIGKTYKLPPNVTKPPAQCVTGARTKRSRRAPTVVPLCQRQQHRQGGDSLAVAAFKAKLSSQRRSGQSDGKDNVVFDMPKLSPKDEFLYIAKAIKNAIRREKLKQSKMVRLDPDQHQHQQQKQHQNFREDEDEGYGAPDFGGGEEDDADDFGYCGGDDDENDNGDGNTDFGNMEDNMFVNDGNDNEEGQTGKTFEELCRAHIQAFAKSAEAYANETKLSKRVDDWHSKLSPILEEEENRREFDIHAYSKRILTLIQENSTEDPEDDANPVVGFESVTQGCKRYDVCRFFLSSLSLSNSGNVQLQEDSEGGFQLELLDDAFELPMETFLAPSVRES